MRTWTATLVLLLMACSPSFDGASLEAGQYIAEQAMADDGYNMSLFTLEDSGAGPNPDVPEWFYLYTCTSAPEAGRGVLVVVNRASEVALLYPAGKECA